VSTFADLRATGLSARVIDWWTRKGYLHAYPRDDTAGPGIPREWPGTEITIARTMKRLVDAGITPAKAAQIARDTLTSDEPVPLGPGLLLTITGGER
jgi:hypothetical protein